MLPGYPEPHPESESRELDLLRLQYKVDCGADFVVTQLFYDNREYFDFVDRAGRLGIPCRIIPGIMPIVNYRQIVRITRLCGANNSGRVERPPGTGRRRS